MGRFISADGIVGDGLEIHGYNMFTYCSNNPIIRIDDGGRFWDTLFDIVSLVVSVVDVIQHPDDPMAWIGLAGDAIDLIPFVTCVGETIRAVNTVDNIVDVAKTADRVVDAADDVHDVVKAVDNTTDSIKTARSRALRQAWGNEFDNVSSGGSGVSRTWTDNEIDELLTNGKVKGYEGHHMKSVKGYPELAGDPTNIQFLSRSDHLKAHGGNWKNITHGRYYE